MVGARPGGAAPAAGIVLRPCLSVIQDQHSSVGRELGRSWEGTGLKLGGSWAEVGRELG